jgi:hypothetical protein
MNPSTHPRLRSPALPLLMLVAVAAACTGQEEAPLQLPSDTEVSELRGGTDTAGRALIPFTVIQDDIGGAGQTEARRIITSDAAYRSYFGHGAPAEVDFNVDWVFFYSAGDRPSAGYTASLLSITRAGGDIGFVTSLLSPGPSCVNAAVITRPFVLAKFPRQIGALSVHYYRADRAGASCAVDPCATVRCASGHRCVLEPVVCIKEPCDPQPRCVPVAEVSCGGFSGKACPGAGVCADDPRDTCDPNKGGRDCSGLCECQPTGLCRTGKWDSNPAVCGCVP